MSILLPTVITLVFDELLPRKLVKRSVIVYDAGLSLLLSIVIGLCTWLRELNLFK